MDLDPSFAGEVQLLEKKKRQVRDWERAVTPDWLKDKTLIYSAQMILFFFCFPLGEIQGSSVGNTIFICRFTGVLGLGNFPHVSWGLW